jgi:hypothetical protein
MNMGGTVPKAAVDAIEILKGEHRRLAEQFREFFSSRAESRRHDLITEICDDLKLHIAVEGDIFYPAYLCATQDSLTHFVAFVNHESAKKLIEEIENADPADEEFSTKVYALSRMVAHHSNEAEKPNGMFEEAQMSRMDRNAIGRALLMRKLELSEAWEDSWRISPRS